MRLRSASAGLGSRPFPESRSERNLAVAILRQAWHEAVMDLRSVKETSRSDYRVLKKKAIEWISTDEAGFPYWCKLAEVDHQAVRQRLALQPTVTLASETLDMTPFSSNRLSAVKG